jgi:excisionase family DNA binding protein
MTAKSELLTACELADRLKLCEETVRRLARDGVIPSFRIGGRTIRFDAQAVEAALRGGAAN